MNREFLMLAHQYKPNKYDVKGWYLSEKLDGFRAFWDGGLSRGMPTKEVPWAGMLDPKTQLEKSRIKPISTGLWSRYGNPIMAPDWFLNQLPPLMLDGELWAGRGGFQKCRSICSSDIPGPGWHDIEYAIFSTPHPGNFAFDGIIKNANMYCVMNSEEIYRWIQLRNMSLGGAFMRIQDGADFEEELTCLREAFDGVGSSIYLHHQRKLPMTNVDEAINVALDSILANGGEGVVIRDSTSQWEPRRVRTMLKYKPFSDAEAVITGFTSGRKTDKGSKFLGKIGALIVKYNGKRLELSGLTDEERAFAGSLDTQWATNNPGVDAPYWVEGKHFRLGQTITFKYRELSDEGIPKEGRYWRKRGNE